MKIKMLLLAGLQIAAMWGSNALAIPILNENKSPVPQIMIYADSQDANYYYYVPDRVALCKDEHGRFMFSFSLLKTGGLFSRKSGLMQAILCVQNNSAGLEAAMKALVAANPSAKFGAMPFEGSSVAFDAQTAPDVAEASGCNHIAGEVGQEQACSILFKPESTPGVIRRLENGGMIGMNFTFTVQGVDRYPDGLHAKTQGITVEADIIGNEFGGQLSSYIQK